MKLLIAIMLLAMGNFASAEPRCYDLVLTGKTQAGPNANEDAAVRKLVASFVERLFVKTYVLQDSPVNGGFHVCLDPNGDTGYWGIYSDLGAIAIRNSIWEINFVETCSQVLPQRR